MNLDLAGSGLCGTFKYHKLDENRLPDLILMKCSTTKL